MLDAVALTRMFVEKAEAVSARVARMPDRAAAFAYAVDLCERKEACQLLLSGCEAPLSQRADELCQRKAQKVMAAPGLAEPEWNRLQSLCRDRGIALVDDTLRRHLAGIDIAVTAVDYGIAETGTLVLDSSSEALRLATMISEIHVALLPISKIRETAFALEAELAAWMEKIPNYTAFITGASRTADIERVLAIGVHGPLELHILLLEE
jgi:L-lactate dehydrogenase complex protein LldG